MSDHTARLLGSDECRTAHDVFRGALHQAPATDEQWERAKPTYEGSRTFGVFDDELIGTTHGWDDTLVVPGGAVVSNAPVTGVGVRSDRTRRGVLTELMRAQLSDLAQRGTVTASLHATEGRIYGRFGYGMASYSRSCTVEKRAARLRDDVPGGGEVRRLGVDDAFAWLPQIYRSLRYSRPGMLGRAPTYWAKLRATMARQETPPVTVVHDGPSGTDGFVVYSVRWGDERSELTVFDMHADNVDAFVGLWRYLLGVDLVDRITLQARPLDEAAALLFTDPRAYQDNGAADEIWLRLVDVTAALAALPACDEQLVIEVTDRILESNSGRYALTRDGVRRSDAAADMSLDVDTLAMIYLGAWRPSTLAAFGRIRMGSSEAAARADRMFDAHRAPWCGTFF